MTKSEERPDKDRLRRKAQRALELLDDEQQDPQELIELLGEVFADSGLVAGAARSESYNDWQALSDIAMKLQSTLIWAKEDEMGTNQPVKQRRAEISAFRVAVEDVTKRRE